MLGVVKYSNMGFSGQQVGVIGLGTLTWGQDTELAETRSILELLLEADGNFIETSPHYGAGQAEKSVGTLLSEQVCTREEIVIQTQTGILDPHTDSGINNGRNALYTSLHQSLKNLGTDYIDILAISRPNPTIPLEETLLTLTDFIRSGKVRYLSFSNHPAWLSAKATQFMQDQHLPKPTALALPYSILQRKAETEHFALAKNMGLGIVAYSPLAGGVLTGKYRNTIPPTSRAATKHLNSLVAPYLLEKPRKITEAVIKAADGLGLNAGEISLAWTLQHPEITTLACGVRTAKQAQQLFNKNIDSLPEQVFAALTEISN